MSSAHDSGFGKYVPGFDFLQTLAKQGGQMPGLPSWVAPTMDPKEIDKRIEELKAGAQVVELGLGNRQRGRVDGVGHGSDPAGGA